MDIGFLELDYQMDEIIQLVTKCHEFKLAIKMTEILGCQNKQYPNIISEWTLAMLKEQPEQAEDAIKQCYEHPKVKEYLTDINFCELDKKSDHKFTGILL